MSPINLTAVDAALAIVATAFYVEAGRRTFQVMMLTEPAGSAEPAYLALREHRLPSWAFAGYVALWLPIAAAALALTQWQKRGEQP